MKICVSGMIAVGKTSFVNNISKMLSLEKVIEKSLGIRYLPRLFKNPTRWGFEAQAAFLIDKARGILEKSRTGSPFLVDRSLEEDVKIFYEYFSQEHSIDNLSNVTYKKLYKLIKSIIPKTSIQIVCVIDRNTALERIKHRDSFNSYVEGYIDSIYNRYGEYIKELRGKNNTYICDAKKYDWTNSKICEVIAEDLKNIIRGYRYKHFKKQKLSILEEHK